MIAFRSLSQPSPRRLQPPRVRAMLGRFSEAREDAEQSLAMVGDNPARKAQRELDVIRLSKDIPGYAN